jgi:hypothetical protein
MRDNIHALLKLVIRLIVTLAICGCSNKINLTEQPILMDNNEYVVSFVDNDGRSFPILTKKIIAGQKVGELYSPFKNGYNFSGWFNEKGWLMTENSIIFEDTIVYARYDTLFQMEFNAYDYSEKVKSLLLDDGYIYLLENILILRDLVSFSREELRFLRNMIYAKYSYKFNSQELINFFSRFKWYDSIEDNVDSFFTDIDKKNVQFIKILENNFPKDNERNNDLIGLWRLAYAVPDQGYFVGDYIKLYNNGIFEYVFRNFQAERHSNQIFGGSKYGLWTTNSENIIEYDYDMEIIDIPEIRTIYDNHKIITVNNEDWWIISNDVNYGLEW